MSFENATRRPCDLRSERGETVGRSAAASHVAYDEPRLASGSFLRTVWLQELQQKLCDRFRQIWVHTCTYACPVLRQKPLTKQPKQARCVSYLKRKLPRETKYTPFY